MPPQTYNEWQVLQNQYFEYEKYSLLVKLLSIVFTVLFTVWGIPFWMIESIIAVLWMQDAIWKTFQTRTGKRILSIEQLIATNLEQPSHQFHSEWLENRTNGTQLIFEYLKHALKPTVAYPYALLIMISIIHYVKF